MPTIFGSDRPLLYDVEPWNVLGFAVPNFGDNVGTLNSPIWGLADEIGRAQLYIMTHIDAQRTQPPSINTVMRLGKTCNRIHSVLAGRQKLDNELRLEEVHASADLIPWNIHPAPFFNSSLCRNKWLKEYNRLCVIALTNIYQHSDNNQALTVTQKMAQDIWQYFAEIKILVGTELLGLTREVVAAEDFVFTDTHYAAYNPSSFTLNFEALDTPGPIQSRVTEDDIRPLFEGIPSVIIQEYLVQYPVGGNELGLSGVPVPGVSEAPGVSDGATAPAGGTIGSPTI